MNQGFSTFKFGLALTLSSLAFLPVGMMIGRPGLVMGAAISLCAGVLTASGAVLYGRYVEWRRDWRRRKAKTSSLGGRAAKASPNRLRQAL